jgi:hypothetical protein
MRSRMNGAAAARFGYDRTPGRTEPPGLAMPAKPELAASFIASPHHVLAAATCRAVHMSTATLILIQPASAALADSSEGFGVDCKELLFHYASVPGGSLQLTRGAHENTLSSSRQWRTCGFARELPAAVNELTWRGPTSHVQ